MATFNCLPLDQKSRERRTREKDPSSTCLDSAIQILEQNPELESQFSSISNGLHYIQGFLLSVRFWSSNPDHSQLLSQLTGDVIVSRIEDAFEMAGLEIRNAIEKGDAQLLNTVQCKLCNKIKLFKAIIRKAYCSVNSTWTYNSEIKFFGCVIDKISTEYHLVYDEEWETVRKGLVLIRTFITSADVWSRRDEVIGQQVEEFGKSIYNYVMMTGHGIQTEITEGDADGLNALSSNMIQMIEMWKPRILESYDFIIGHIFQIMTPFLRKRSLSDVVRGLENNAREVLYNIWGNDDLRRDFHVIVCTLESLGRRSKPERKRNESIRQCAYLFQWAAMNVARLLFLAWADEMDPKDVILTISDLLQRIKPTSPETLVMYMQFLNDQDYGRVTMIVALLLPSQTTSLEAHEEGLKYLLQSEHVKLLGLDIESLVWNLASFSYSYFIAAHDNDELFFQLLLKIELLKVELVFISPIPIRFEPVYMGLSSVKSVLVLATDVYSERLVSIFSGFEEMVRKVELLDQGSLSVKLLYLGFKLMKIQAILMGQMRCSPCLIPLFHDQIYALNEGLELLFKYFSFLPTENQGDEELILTYMERLGNHKMPPYCFSISEDPQHFINKLSDFLTTMLQEVHLMNSEVQQNAREFKTSLALPFPLTLPSLGFAELFLKKLSGLMEYKAGSIGVLMKHQIEQVLKELGSLTSFLLKVGKKSDKHSKLNGIQGRVMRAAYLAEYLIDWILIVKCDWNRMLWLSDVINDMKALNFELTTFVQVKNDLLQFFEQVPVTLNIISKVGEAEVSLEDQEAIVIDRLTIGTSQRRVVVTISGMPGIGKTTLAKNVYHQSQIKNHFRVLAWCCVSQVYRVRELLLKILGDITKSNIDDMDKKTEDDLLDMLYKGLKGKRYCVVMDDVWSSQVWEELKFAFPDDKNGSRILITTRNKEVGLSAEPHSNPHTLRFLSGEESWKLLQERIFQTDECPKDLFKVGMEIAKGCKGLPMAIVAIAGLLRTSEKSVELWESFEKDLNSHILESPEIQCMRILELSYNHLPERLKSCFLYFAAFGEDSEVQVQKLIQLWLAEGFVGELQGVSPEDVAESYVMNLVGRSLLLAAKIGSSGSVKTCKVHDMVYNLCLRKSREENFLQYIDGYGDLFPSSNSHLDYGAYSNYPQVSITYDQHRLSICSKRNQFVTLKPSGPYVRTLLFSATSDTYPRCPYDEISFITDQFKILNILDIDSINIGSSFPKGIEMVYSLRYLAVSGDIRCVPSTIAKLWNLESFGVKGLIGTVALPDTLWSMPKLRHLHVSPQAKLSLKDGSLESSAKLDDLITLSCLALSHGDEEMMKLFPKLQNLRCTFSESMQHSAEKFLFPIMDFLEELSSLKIIYYGSALHYCQIKEACFPLNLKKLSLSHFRFRWDDFSSIGKLPNLLILKLVSVAFDSPVWKMQEDEFQKLEYLKLDSIKIRQWHAESDHLPNIRQLMLRSCIRLEEVPASLGEIATLERVELKWCSVSAENSVMTIVEQKLDYGDKDFKAFINGFVADFKDSMDD